MKKKVSGIAVAKLDSAKCVIPKGVAAPVAYWRVTLGRKITGGKKLRKLFAKEREALDFVDTTLNRKTVEGTQTFDISSGLRVEARQCQELLIDAGNRAGRSITLTEAVEFFIRHALPTGGVIDFSDAREKFLASRKSANLKPRYLRNLVSQFDQMATALGARRINLITTGELEDWLDKREQSPKTRNNYVVTMRTFFGYCKDQKWCAENPALALGKAKVEDAPAGILTPNEANRLILAIKAHAPQVLPTVLIQLFAGLRRSEACALDWTEVKQDVVEVTAIKAKTRSRRVVDIQPKLAEWLNPLRKARGPVCPYGEDGYGEFVREAIAKANGDATAKGHKDEPLTWKHNCLRHTCASMHLAHFADESRTALQMGHAVDVLHRHYKGLVTTVEAAGFWELGPAKHEGKAKSTKVLHELQNS